MNQIESGDFETFKEKNPGLKKYNIGSLDKQVRALKLISI